jgi:poly-gamma-glutamate capsule biosynthesis protein CapA/YwtB (metallophosphatase superfamily)
MKLLCLGDIAIGKGISLPYKWLPPGKFQPGDSEKIIFNWELPIGERFTSDLQSTHPKLSVGSETPSILEKWSPGFATLATNHMLDAGIKGITQTIKGLNQIGIETVGAGLVSENIEKPLIWETDIGRLSILNWVFPETNPDWMTVPGVNCWPGVKTAKFIVDEQKKQSDWILVLLHWSDELFYYPRPEDRDTARELAKMGVDAIIGHHPHVVRGFETVGACPIYYSLGNFFFSDFQDIRGRWIQQSPLNRQSLGVILNFKKGELPELSNLSFIQVKNETIIDPLRRSELRLRKLSKPLIYKDQKNYAVWHKKRRSRFMTWEAKWEFGIRKLGLLGSLKFIYKQSKFLLKSSFS